MKKIKPSKEVKNNCKDNTRKSNIEDFRKLKLKSLFRLHKCIFLINRRNRVKNPLVDFRLFIQQIRLEANQYLSKYVSFLNLAQYQNNTKYIIIIVNSNHITF